MAVRIALSVAILLEADARIGRHILARFLERIFLEGVEGLLHSFEEAISASVWVERNQNSPAIGGVLYGAGANRLDAIFQFASLPSHQDGAVSH